MAAWDAVADVVVIGYGGAGAAAAIAASDAGARVTILEKLGRGGGNTAISGGGFIEAGNADDAFRYLEKTFDFADNEMDAEAVRAFCREAVRTREFLRGLDPSASFGIWGYANFKSLPCSGTITKYYVEGGPFQGRVLFNLLDRAARQRGAQVRCRTPALRLLEEDGELCGVLARDEAAGKDIRIRARRAVILACGGYEYDPESLRTFCLGRDVGGLGSPGNTGDGLRMAQELGAALWHMTSYSCPLGIRIPGKRSLCLFSPMTPGYIWVNQGGRRFVNEAGLDLHSGLYAVNRFDATRLRYSEIPCWCIMDEKGRLAGPITHRMFGYLPAAEGYCWSDGCEKEIEAGIVRRSETLAGLAAQIGVPADELEKTVARWNEGMARGCDPEFGRAMARPPKEKFSMKNATATVLSAPLLTPPYYAVALYPALLNTQGGPRRNARAQVLDAWGKPIRRLYSAGELGSIWGSIYQGSGNVSECLVFGQIAGRNAAGEPPLGTA